MPQEDGVRHLVDALPAGPAALGEGLLQVVLQEARHHVPGHLGGLQADWQEAAGGQGQEAGAEQEGDHRGGGLEQDLELEVELQVEPEQDLGLELELEVGLKQEQDVGLQLDERLPV